MCSDGSSRGNIGTARMQPEQRAQPSSLRRRMQASESATVNPNTGERLVHGHVVECHGESFVYKPAKREVHSQVPLDPTCDDVPQQEACGVFSKRGVDYVPRGKIVDNSVLSAKVRHIVASTLRTKRGGEDTSQCPQLYSSTHTRTNNRTTFTTRVTGPTSMPSKQRTPSTGVPELPESHTLAGRSLAQKLDSIINGNDCQQSAGATQKCAKSANSEHLVPVETSRIHPNDLSGNAIVCARGTATHGQKANSVRSAIQSPSPPQSKPKHKRPTSLLRTVTATVALLKPTSSALKCS
jgi:hypothetical protein